MDNIDKALDPNYLTSLLKKSVKKEEEAVARLQTFNQKPGYISFSGGKDSLVALHLSIRAGRECSPVFFCSDLEFPENLPYIEATCDYLGVEPLIIKPRTSILELIKMDAWYDNTRDSIDTDLLVHEEKILYPSRKAHERYGNLAIWGLRANESSGRAALLRPGRGYFARKSGTETFSPVWNWTTKEIWGYIKKYNLPVNPVYTKYREMGVPEDQQRVGSVFDGHTGLDFGGVRWLRQGWPETYDILRKHLPRIEEYI